MNQGLIAIMDLDEIYAKKLSDYFRFQQGICYDIVTFTDMDIFMQFIKKQFVDILLIDEMILGDDKPLIPLEPITSIQLNSLKSFCRDIFILSHGLPSPLSTFAYIVYKFQSARDILHYVMSSLTIDVGPSIMMGNAIHTKIYGVYSPIKRSGRTSLSVVLSELLALSSPTLFISFDVGFGALETGGNQSTLTDLLYYYTQSPESLASRLASITCSLASADFIPQVKIPMDISQADPATLSELVTSIQMLSTYSFIILDISDLPADVAPLLKVCQTIYSPVLNDSLSLSKLSSFKQYIESIDSSLPQKFMDISLPEISPSTNDYIHNLMDSPLFDYCKNLLKEMI